MVSSRTLIFAFILPPLVLPGFIIWQILSTSVHLSTFHLCTILAMPLLWLRCEVLRQTLLRCKLFVSPFLIVKKMCNLFSQYFRHTTSAIRSSPFICSINFRTSHFLFFTAFGTTFCISYSICFGSFKWFSMKSV